MAGPIQRIKQFYGETLQEVKKCSWPSRSQLIESTVLIIAAIVLLTVFVWLVDVICQYLIRWIFKLSELL